MAMALGFMGTAESTGLSLPFKRWWIHLRFAFLEFVDQVLQM